jgi:bacterioferritin
MGSKGKEIVKVNVEKILEMLNKAFADEWLAYHQYWLGAKLAQGPMKGEVVAELEQHAADELRHSLMLLNRIIQLDGTPPLSPQDWYKKANCKYAAPSNPFVDALLKQNIQGEQCAIEVYNKLLLMTKDKDPVTYDIALQILEDEIEHEEDLEKLLEDIKIIKLK